MTSSEEDFPSMAPKDVDTNTEDRSPSDELPSWMKSALAGVSETRVDVLRGVQERLRERSGGKFYKDGWSTTRHAPFATYFLTALLMLAALVLIYAMLVPVVPDPVSGQGQQQHPSAEPHP